MTTYTCACGVKWTPKTLPHTRHCDCGATITVGYESKGHAMTDLTVEETQEKVRSHLAVTGKEFQKRKTALIAALDKFGAKKVTALKPADLRPFLIELGLVRP